MQASKSCASKKSPPTAEKAASDVPRMEVTLEMELERMMDEMDMSPRPKSPEEDVEDIELELERLIDGAFDRQGHF